MRTEVVAFELGPELVPAFAPLPGKDSEARWDVQFDPALDRTLDPVRDPDDPALDFTLDPALGDRRFRALLRNDEWASLPPAVRRRFSKRLPPGSSTVYAGEVLETKMNFAGWLLAQALRLIGAPLPTTRCRHVPSIVTVTEDKAIGGQVWTRIYPRPNKFPQVVHSAKRFAGPSGLEEYVGHGIGMALDLSVRDGALIFRSRNYFLQVFGRRFVLPAWLSPGDLTIVHAEVPDERFSFTLQIVHPHFGLILQQMALYRELVR
jgi:hypothetical protein